MLFLVLPWRNPRTQRGAWSRCSLHDQLHASREFWYLEYFCLLRISFSEVKCYKVENVSRTGTLPPCLQYIVLFHQPRFPYDPLPLPFPFACMPPFEGPRRPYSNSIRCLPTFAKVVSRQQLYCFQYNRKVGTTPHIKQHIPPIELV